MRAVFLDYETVSFADLDTSTLLDAAPGMRLYGATAQTEIAARIADSQIILLNKLPLSRAQMHGAPELRLICLAATGTDNVDLVAARERGIAVCNVRNYCTPSVVQHVWGMILGLTQHLREYRRLALDGSWAGSAQFTVLAHPIRELAGRIFGVVGWGELGRAVAGVAQAFGMQVRIANRPGGERRPDRLDLRELLPIADILTLHCPLGDATRGLIGAAELALMKPDALLINTARGALIDGAALAAALKAGKLGGAGIDVLPQEPPAAGDPLLEPGIPNLIVTPHVAWAARESRQRCIDSIAANIREFLAGRRRNRVV
ncbi:MAG TPA: NAD(P)-dependent oxidoreductase [Steroidobacteraceae bacterium]|nr:NAD(P)-dependent oxidoreductase [Steroidobacteraceae bacterium]